jgi:hypothetical protein
MDCLRMRIYLPRKSAVLERITSGRFKGAIDRTEFIAPVKLAVVRGSQS